LTVLLILILILANTLVFTKGIAAQKGYFVKAGNPDKELAYLAIQGNKELDLYPLKPNIDTSSQIVLADYTEDSPSAQNNTTSTLEEITANGASTTQNLSLQGGVSFGSGIKVKELAEFQSSVLIQERLNVGTLSTFGGDLVAQQDATVYGSATINQDLTVGTKDLYVDTVTDRVGIGTKHPQRKLDVAGDAKIGGQLLVIEDTHLYDTLTVDGWTKMTGILNADGGIEVDGDRFIVDGKTGDVETKGSMTVEGQTNFNSQVNLSGDLVPSADNTRSLGSSLYRWKDLYLGPASLKIYNSIGANAEYMTLGFDSNVATLNITRDGSGTYRPFAINQNGSEIIRIINSRLGIGTTNPLYKLDVSGDARIQGGELYLSGIASSSSTTEGTLYYDTDDDQLKVYANGKWQADRSTATFIVAANDSQNKEKADYACDGTNDQTVIVAAVNALPAAGGTIKLLEGTYHIQGYAVVTRGNIAITGSGKGTILSIETPQAALYFSHDEQLTDISVSDLSIIDYDPIAHANGEQSHGISFSNVKRGKVINCYFKDIGDEAIEFATGSEYGLVANNSFDGCPSIEGSAISINSSNRILATGNTIEGGQAGAAISIETSGSTSSSENVISNNIIKDNIGSYAILLNTNQYSVNDTLISGNFIDHAGVSIGVSGSFDRDGISVIGNIINGNVNLEGDNILVQNNKIKYASGILLNINSGNSALVDGNIFSSTTSYAVRFSSVNGAVLSNNKIYDVGSAGVAACLANSCTGQIIAKGNYVSPNATATNAFQSFTIVTDNTIVGGCTQYAVTGGQIVSNNHFDHTIGTAAILQSSGATKAVVTGNRIIHPVGVGIYLYQTSDVMVSDNYIQDATTWAIDEGSTSDYNRIINNNVRNGNTNPIRYVGSNTIVKDNVGFATQNSGTSTISSGNTYTDVSHGIDTTPAISTINVVPTNSLGNANKFWTSDVGASTFRINTDLNPGDSTATFSWQIGSY